MPLPFHETVRALPPPFSPQNPVNHGVRNLRDCRVVIRYGTVLVQCGIFPCPMIYEHVFPSIFFPETAVWREKTRNKTVMKLGLHNLILVLLKKKRKEMTTAYHITPAYRKKGPRPPPNRSPRQPTDRSGLFRIRIGRGVARGGRCGGSVPVLPIAPRIISIVNAWLKPSN